MATKFRKFHLIVDTKIPEDCLKDEETKHRALHLAKELLTHFLIQNNVASWNYNLIETSLIGAKVIFHVSLKIKEASDMYLPLDFEIIELDP